MSSTILYKFRSGTTFEALPLPGSAARLFDVKKGIVTAKKLDTGSMEFDLSVRNANTNEEYVDESMLLPRGTRLIVQRLPAAKGQGFLARMARNQYGIVPGAAGGGAGASGHHPASQGAAGGAAPSGFYTIDSTARDEEDEEFVNTRDEEQNEEDKELAALKAVTDTATAASSGGLRPAASNFGKTGGPAGQGPPPRQTHHHHHHHAQQQQQGVGSDQAQQQQHRQANQQMRQRPNADPELREQDKKLQPKKRATGIPRTFLSLNGPAAETQDGEEGENGAGGGGPQIQPNTLGFEELKNRGGGQSESASGTKKDLDYALKITGTAIPDYLQCGICHGVVRNAMFLPWDPEGRTACETCIRDALTQNGFRCPLTGMEGISPDDLHPNPGLRRAADEFVKGVMEKIEEIEKQQVDEEEAADQNEAGKSKGSDNFVDQDGGEKGIIVNKRNTVTNKRKGRDDDDPFGGEDDFGGDVFAVSAAEKPTNDKPAEEELKDESVATPTKGDEVAPVEEEEKEKSPESKIEPSPVPAPKPEQQAVNTPESSRKGNSMPSNGAGGSHSPNNNNSAPADSNNLDTQHVEPSSSSERKGPSPPQRNDSDRRQQDHRRDAGRQRRGPPAGYQMGPAGGATGPAGYQMGPAGGASGPIAGRNDRYDDDRSFDRRGGGGRGRGGRSPQQGRAGRFNDRGGAFRGRGGRGGRGRFHAGGPGRGNYGDSFDDGRRGGIRHSPARDDFSNNEDERSSKRPRHGSRDFDDGRQDSWDDRSVGSGSAGGGFHPNRGPPPGGRRNVPPVAYRGPPRGRGGRGDFRGDRGDFRGGYDDRFDRGGRGGGRSRGGGGGGRYRGRGRY